MSLDNSGYFVRYSAIPYGKQNKPNNKVIAKQCESVVDIGNTYKVFWRPNKNEKKIKNGMTHKELFKIISEAHEECERERRALGDVYREPDKKIAEIRQRFLEEAGEPKFDS